MSDDQHDAVIGRLEREREQAERRYVAALAALDTASQLPDSLVTSAAAIEAEVVRLNTIWRQTPAGANPGSPPGFLSRVITEIGRLMPWRRRALHGAMLATINRQAELTRADRRHAAVPLARDLTGRLSRLRGNPAPRRRVPLRASRWFMPLSTRRDRLAAAVDAPPSPRTAIRRAHRGADKGIRRIAGGGVLAHQARRLSGAPSRRCRQGSSGQAVAATSTAAPSAGSTAAPDRTHSRSVAFEDRYRGSTDEIRKRLQDYLPLLRAQRTSSTSVAGAELLELLREQGVQARGIDINDEMVACAGSGLTADKADAITFLNAQPEQSLGGLIAIRWSSISSRPT